MEIPSGWFEVIRGPRPPSVRWPQAHVRQPPRGQLFEGERGRRSGPGVQSRPNGSAQSAPQQRSAAETNPMGIKVLGIPVGSAAFVQETVSKRLRLEAQLWDAIPSVPDLQAAWQILLQCAGPRCHHILRTLPPSQSEVYARSHDEGMERVMRILVGIVGERQEHVDAADIASLPMRMGGLGLRRATRMALAAYWASWADALQMVDQRLP